MTEKVTRIGDLAKGMAAIADYLGVTQRQAFHLHEQGLLPTFHIGKSVCARRSALDKWLDEKSRQAREGKDHD